MLKVCIIGIGNAGNQVAELAKKEKNIPGIAINSSDKDLSNISHIEKIIIGDEKGAGKDRNEAKTFVKQNIQDLFKLEFLKNLLTENEVVFMVSSTGGGTGSGMTPILTEILSKAYQNKKFILVEILPPISESVAAQQNTIDFLQEVRKFLPNVTYIPYDNHRRSNIPPDKMMEEINREIVEDICVIRGDYQFPTPYTSIDEKDMFKLIETPGRLTIVRLSGIKEKDLDDKSIEEMLVSIIKNTSVTSELERDKIVKRLGLITNLNEKIHKTLNMKLEVFKAFVGEPVEGFEHIYINKAQDDPNRVMVILAGLSVPDDRIQKIIQRIDDVMKEISKTKESSLLDEVSTEGIEALRDTGPKTTQDVLDLNDIFSKYQKK